jgi:hypothetical protein
VGYCFRHKQLHHCAFEMRNQHRLAHS